MRLQGPNFHSISFGYALAIISGFVAVHGRLLLPLAALPLLLAVGAKGALALLLIALAFCFVSRFYQGVLLPIGLASILALYAAFAFISGLQIGDFHVLGLIGGINGFLSNPAGHSLGAGGNLSTNFAGIDWSKYQHEGATDIAVESAAGVLLYQMGVAGVAVIAIYLWLARTAWRLFQTLARARAGADRRDRSRSCWSTACFRRKPGSRRWRSGSCCSSLGLTLGAVDRRVVSQRSRSAARCRRVRFTGRRRRERRIRPLASSLVQTQAENAGAQEISRLHRRRSRGARLRRQAIVLLSPHRLLRRRAPMSISAPPSGRAVRSPSLRFLFALYRRLRAMRPDVVVTFQHYGNVIAAPIARLAGARANHRQPGVGRRDDGALGRRRRQMASDAWASTTRSSSIPNIPPICSRPIPPPIATGSCASIMAFEDKTQAIGKAEARAQPRLAARMSPCLVARRVCIR